MPSSPPTPTPCESPPVLPRLSEASFRARAIDETVVFVCVEGAPLEACRTRTGVAGSLTFDTQLCGRVVGIDRERLELAVGERTVIVRHLLPSAIDLDALAGQAISVYVAQCYSGPGRATIDAEIRDASGRLILWAHDGRMPADRASHGLALRCTVDAELRGTRAGARSPRADAELVGRSASGGARHRLAIGHGGGIACLGAPDLCHLRIGADAFDLAVVRVRADDVSFVLLRA